MNRSRTSTAVGFRRFRIWLAALILLCQGLQGLDVRAQTLEERIRDQQEMTVESNEIRAGPPVPWSRRNRPF